MLKKLWRLILRLFGLKDKGVKVPQGLEVFDESGSVLVDSSKRMTHMLFIINVDVPTKNYTLTHDMFRTNKAFFIAPPTTTMPGGGRRIRIDISQSGNVCTLSTENLSTGGSIHIGVY